MRADAQTRRIRMAGLFIFGQLRPATYPSFLRYDTWVAEGRLEGSRRIQSEGWRMHPLPLMGAGRQELRQLVVQIAE